MHLGFDISQVGTNPTGCGYYTQGLIQSLLPVQEGSKFSLYTTFGGKYFDPSVLRANLAFAWRHRGVRFGAVHFLRSHAIQFWGQPQLEQALKLPDVIHANSYWCPAQLHRARLIYTLYDMSFAFLPEHTTESNRLQCFSGVFQAALSADWIIAISHSTRDDFLHIFPHFPADKIRVIHPGCRFLGDEHSERVPRIIADRGLAARDFWLSVGTLEPRKNHRRIAHAYADYLRQGGPPMPLVFAGGAGWMMQDFNGLLERLGIHEQCVVTGYVTDQELVWLYRHCFAHLYPSSFEGVGLPVIEGFSFAAPTILSDANALREIGVGAALSVPADDTAAWTRAMLSLSREAGLREHLSSEARKRAAIFSWQHSAREVADLYAEAVSLPKRDHE